MFKVECPKTWDKDYMLEKLIRNGYFIIATSTSGPLPFWATLTGVNYINFPTGAMIAVPVLGNWEVTLGVDAALIYLEHSYNRNFYRLEELIKVTAQRLASCDCGIDVNIFNSRLAYVAEAESKAQSDTIKAVFDEVSEGNPLVVYRKSALTQGVNGLQMFFNNIRQNYISNEMLDTKRSIMNEFLTAIGINNANTDKRERLITNEVNANNIELDANTAHWADNLERQTEEVNSLFTEINFSIELRYSKITKRMIEDLMKEDTDDTTEHNNDMGNES